MAESTPRRLVLTLLAMAVVTIISVSIAIIQWQSANASKRQADLAARNASDASDASDASESGAAGTVQGDEEPNDEEPNDNARDDQSGEANRATDSTKEATSEPPAGKRPSSLHLEPANVVGVYQELAQSYAAQSQMLKTAKTAGRQKKALDFLKRAASIQAITNELSDGSGTSGSNAFWNDFIPQLRNDAISWMGQT